MPYTPAQPKILTDPGSLFWNVLGAALPANTVANGAFDSAAWAAAATPWVPLGMTDAGSTFSTNTTINPIELAEQLDPVAYRTVSRSTTFSFALASITATNLSKAMNGAVTTVTGSALTTLTQLDPVVLGQETRCQIGWESLDGTIRIFGFQVVNSGDISLKFDKAPSHTSIPWSAMAEVPASGKPWQMFFAGTTRA